MNIIEDSDLIAISVINGDTLNGTQINPSAIPITLTIIGGTIKGSTTINNATGVISYKPNLNANGTDSFTYTVTVNGVTSYIATALINIVPVNDVPITNTDKASSAVDTPLIIDVLANYTDVGGDLLSIVPLSLTALSSPPSSTFTATVNANNMIAFTGNGVGNYQFRYLATDGSAQSSQYQVITINLSSPEAVNATSVQYVANKGRWRVSGTTSIVAAHNMTLSFIGSCNANGRLIGTTSSAAGAFTFDLNTAVGGPLDSRTTNCNAVRVDSTLGGYDLTTPITIK